MLPRSLFVVAASLSTAVLGAPYPLTKRDWVNENGGNLKFTFSDAKINLGDITIQKVIDALGSACNTNGLCDTSPITIDGVVAAGSPPAGTLAETLTVNPGGSYDTWIHNGLIDALHAAANTITECNDVSWTPACQDPMHGVCDHNVITINECTTPQFWGIRYEADDDTSGAYMELDMSVTVDNGLGGFCSTIAGIGGAVSTAVGEALPGTVFAVMSILCGTVE